MEYKFVGIGTEATQGKWARFGNIMRAHETFARWTKGNITYFITSVCPNKHCDWCETGKTLS